MELLQLGVVGSHDLYASNKKVNDWINKVKAKCQPYFDESMVKTSYLKDMFVNAK